MPKEDIIKIDPIKDQVPLEPLSELEIKDLQTVIKQENLNTERLNLSGKSLKERSEFVMQGSVEADGTVVTVSNTTTETNLAVYRFSAEDFYAGLAFRVFASGVYTTADAAHQFDIQIGLSASRETAGSANQSSGSTGLGITTPAELVTKASWGFTAYYLVNKIGAVTGDIAGYITGSVSGNVLDSGSESDTAFADTTPIDLVIFATPTSANAGTNISIRQFIVEIIR